MSKVVVLVICLFTSSFLLSQKKEKKEVYVNTNSISIRVDSSEELETINWKDIKSVFTENDPESEISLEIEVKTKEKLENKLKVKLDYSFKSTSKAKDIDSLIIRIKKGVNYINRITKNLNNEN